MKLLDVLTSPWAIIPDKLLEIQAIYFTHLRGEKINIRELEAKIGEPLQNVERPYQVENGVAIISIDGIIAKKMNLMTQISGGVSTQLIKKDFERALADPDVTAILLDIDSPGGTVDGTEELATAIYEARLEGLKPIVAYTDGIMASAAYWIGSAAEAVYISGDTPWVGSIGVVTAHVDYSKWEEKHGIKTTEVYAGKYKRIDSEYAPLSKEGAQYLQDQVDYIYSLFSNTVARNRGLSIAGLADWADGRLFIGKQAVFAGLVDGVSTIDQLLPRLSAEGRDMMLRASILKKIIQKTGGKNMDINAENFKQAYPELHEKIRKEGFDRGYDKGLSEGTARGKLETSATVSSHFNESEEKGESAQIKKTAPARAASESRAADDKTPPRFAPFFDREAFEERIKVKWDNEPETRAEWRGDFEQFKAYSEAEEKGLISRTVKKTADDKTPLGFAPFFDREAFEERIKAKWKSEPATRAEFNGNYESYAAYTEAEEKRLLKNHKGKGGN